MNETPLVHMPNCPNQQTERDEWITDLEESSDATCPTCRIPDRDVR